MKAYDFDLLYVDVQITDFLKLDPPETRWYHRPNARRRLRRSLEPVLWRCFRNVNHAGRENV